MIPLTRRLTVFITYHICNGGMVYYDRFHDCCTELPGAMCKTFQSTSIPLVLNIARAPCAIASNPPVASARIVGPAPERQIPNNPGCVSGVMLDITSGKPGICITD